MARVDEWARDPAVLGVVMVGSKSRGHGDELSDDDLEVLYTDEAHALIPPAKCIEVLIEGEGDSRRLVYDAELTTLAELQRKPASPHDLDHWPYEKALVLFDRDGATADAVKAAARMDDDFRQKRLVHSTIDAWIAPYRAAKTARRGFDGAAHLVVARGAKALSRLLFALEWRWTPLDHWLEPELGTLSDPARVGPLVVKALANGTHGPLEEGLRRLEERLYAEGVPPRDTWRDLFLELIHWTRAEERSIHGLY
jgi:hypothetical protein